MNLLMDIIVATQNFSIKRNLLKIVKPSLVYMFIAALLSKHFDFSLPSSIEAVLINFKATYSILGMMIIGISLANTSASVSVDLKFFTLTMFFKFIIWPIIILDLIYSKMLPDTLLTPSAINAMLLLLIVPLAGNCVVIATQLEARPKEIATIVMMSTLISAIIISVFLNVVLHV